MKNILNILNSVLKNNEAYIVGGAIRDFLLKRKIKDIDIAIKIPNSEVKTISQKLAFYLKSPTFPLDEQRGIWRINLQRNQLTIDITPFENDITKDLQERDFTINAMAISLNDIQELKIENDCFILFGVNKENILNYKNALKDIKKKNIRLNSKNAFIEDPLRMLRAFRFSSSLGFKIEKNTFKEIKEHHELIKNSASERIREELMEILEDKQSWKIIKKMKDSGILFSIFPELKLQEKCAEIYYGKGGVLKHTLNVVKRMELLFLMPQKFLSNSKEIDLNSRIKKLLKLAALLHDIAKPHTAKIINGRLRFFEHEEYGAKLSADLMQRMRFSNEDIKLVTKIIHSHLRVGNLAHNDNISDRAIFRLFSDLGQYTIPLFLLSFADYASYISEKTLIKNARILKQKPLKIPKKGLPANGLKKTIRFIQVTNSLIRYYFKKNKQFNQKNLLSGYDVMSTLKIKEGPAVGYVLKRVKLQQFEGKLKTKEQALEYIKTLKIPEKLI